MCLTRRSLLLGLGAGCACHAAPTLAVARSDWQILCASAGYPSFPDTSALQPAAHEAIQATRLITDAVGILPNFEVLQGSFSRGGRAFATIRNDQRYIVYDRTAFVFAGGRTDWIALGVLAHEVGHHLASHVYINSGSSKDDELEADRFAGFALARLGADEARATAWAHTLSQSGGSTHPPRAKRVVAAREGWRHGQTLKLRERGACSPGWESDPFPVGSRTCRMARVCPAAEGAPGVSGAARTRLACRDYRGDWVWQGE